MVGVGDSDGREESGEGGKAEDRSKEERAQHNTPSQNPSPDPSLHSRSCDPIRAFSPRATPLVWVQGPAPRLTVPQHVSSRRPTANDIATSPTSQDSVRNSTHATSCSSPRTSLESNSLSLQDSNFDTTRDDLRSGAFQNKTHQREDAANSISGERGRMLASPSLEEMEPSPKPWLRRFLLQPCCIVYANMFVHI